jgi:hypothetical protein
MPPHPAALTRDLELETLFTAMAGGDQFLYEVARRAVLSSLKAPDTILYHSIQILELFVGTLRRLWTFADSQAESFRPETRSRAELEGAARPGTPLRLRLHHPRPRRERVQGLGGAASQGNQRGRQRPGPIDRSHPQLLRHAADRARAPGCSPPAPRSHRSFPSTVLGRHRASEHLPQGMNSRAVSSTTLTGRARRGSNRLDWRGRHPWPQARALAFSRSNSDWSIAPASNSSLARAICSVGVA